MKAPAIGLPFRITFCLSLLLSAVASRCCGIEQWTRQAISDSLSPMSESNFEPASGAKLKCHLP